MNTGRPTPIETSQVTGIILSGGQGRRMDYRDKGWIILRGKALVEHVQERLAPQVGNLIISANRNLDAYRQLGYPVISDADNPCIPDDRYQGPIAGITSCLEAVTTEYAVIVPCDAPLVPTNLVTTLLNNTESGQKLVLFDVNGRLQPLFGLYHRSLAKSLRDYYESGERKLISWCKKQNPGIITLEKENPGFANINSPNELARLETDI